MGNSIGNTDKQKKKKKKKKKDRNENMLGRREKSNSIRTKDTTRRNKLKWTIERDYTKQYRQNRIFQNNVRKFYMQIGEEWNNTYY